MSDDDSTTTVQMRQKNPDETDKMAQFESPDGDAICASYISREVADQLGEYAALTISADAQVTARLDGVSGSGTGNYGIYETPGGAVTGLYISHDTLAEVTGEEAVPDNAPESIGLSFAPSSEEEFEEADSVDEEEVEGLLAGSDDSDGAEADDGDDEEEISDEELDLVAEAE